MKNKKLILIIVLLTILLLLIPISILATQNIGVQVEKVLSQEELDEQREQEKRNWTNNYKSNPIVHEDKRKISSNQTIVDDELEISVSEDGEKVNEIIKRFYKSDFERLSGEMQKNADSMSLNELYSQPYAEELFELIIDIIENKDITNDEKDTLKEFLNIQYTYIKDDSSIKLKLDTVLNK